MVWPNQLRGPRCNCDIWAYFISDFPHSSISQSVGLVEKPGISESQHSHPLHRHRSPPSTDALQNRSLIPFSAGLAAGPAELLGLCDDSPFDLFAGPLPRGAAASAHLQLLQHLHPHSPTQPQTQLLEHLSLDLSLQSGVRLRECAQQLLDALPLRLLLLRLLLSHSQTASLRLHFRANQEGDGECSRLHGFGKGLQRSDGTKQFGARRTARHCLLHSPHLVPLNSASPADFREVWADYLPVQTALLFGRRPGETHRSVGALHTQPPPEVQQPSMSLQRSRHTPLSQGQRPQSWQNLVRVSGVLRESPLLFGRHSQAARERVAGPNQQVPIPGCGLGGDLALQTGQTQRGLLHSQQFRSADREEESAVTCLRAETGSDEVLPLTGDQKEVQSWGSHQPVRGQVHEFPNWVLELPQITTESRKQNSRTLGINE